MSKQTIYTRAEVQSKLRGAEEMLGAGVPMTQVCRELNISELTYHRWRYKYGSSHGDRHEVHVLRHEVRRLKEVIADQALEIFDLRNADPSPAPCREWTPALVPLLTNSEVACRPDLELLTTTESLPHSCEAMGHPK